MSFDQALATDLQHRLARGQEVDEGDLTRFLGMVNAEVRAADQAAAPAAEEQLSDQQAHGIYQRIYSDPASVSDEEAERFEQWSAAQLARQDPRNRSTAVPGAGASLQERQAYLEAAYAQGIEPDAETVAAFVADVTKEHAAASEELMRRLPPGMFQPQPSTPDPAQLREQLHGLWEREQGTDPGGQHADEIARQWAQVTAGVNRLVGQAAHEHRSQVLPWVLDSGPQDPGVDPEGVAAMTAPAPWTPREPTETEQTLAELDQLDQDAAAPEPEEAA